MSCLKSLMPQLSFLIPLFLFIFPTLFCLSNGANSHLDDFHDPNVGGIRDNRSINHDAFVQDTRRIISEEITNNNGTYILLAANRTHRRDPSQGFQFYDGGWNITSPNYLLSVAYSGFGPIIVAVVWFVLFGVCLICLSIRSCCCRKKTYGYSRTAYVLYVVLLSFFTIASVSGIIIIYVDQAKFQESIVDVLSGIIKKAHDVVLKLKDLLDSLLEAKNAGFSDIPIPTNIQNQINRDENMINTISDHLSNVTAENSREIRNLLNPLRVTLICVASAMLVLAIFGFFLSILGLKCLVYCLIILGWILITATFVLSGIFLCVNNFVTDTCVAMDEWLQNPNANSALERIIPKVDNKTTEDISSVTKGVTFGLINMVNDEITNVSNAHLGVEAGPLYYNQSGPLVPILCSPYQPDLTHRQCDPAEVNFTMATKVWSTYVCQVSASGICITEGRLTPKLYTEITAAANISSVLYTGIPFVLDLIDSTYLRETFSDISKDYCPSLEHHTRRMYIAFSSSSATVMFSMILWVFYSRERRHRAYNKSSMVRTSSSSEPLDFPHDHA